MDSRVERMEFRGTGGECFGFLITRTLAVVCTLGLYGFWLSKDWKRWVAARTYVHGQPLEYEPRFAEFVLGWLVRFAARVLTLGLYAPWARAKALRYDWRMTRVADGRACRFTGTGGGYLGTWILGVLLTVLTLGFASPWVVAMKTRWVRSHLRVGGESLRFDGTGGQLFWTVLVGRFLTVITFGLYLPWRIVGVQRWIAQHSVVAYGEDTTLPERDAVDEFIARRATDPRTWIAAGGLAALLVLGVVGLSAAIALSGDRGADNAERVVEVDSSTPTLAASTGGQASSELAPAAASSASATTAVPEPSYDCDKARSTVEIAICDDVELARLDKVMADRYLEVRRRHQGADRDALKAEQKAWWREREACADGADLHACLTETMTRRELELRSWSPG
jgi:uncharacterized protein YecT (DUF1311 family)